MANKLTNALLIALLASGCSFIQSWGDYRPGDDGMDAGTDGGGRIDAGDFDAGDSCNFCTSEGCDPSAAECQLDSLDDCFHCAFPGLGEGDFCNNDGECDTGLVCELGRCLIECGASADCGPTLIANDECVFGIDRSVCLDHECDPLLLDDCDPEDFCFVGPYDEDARQAASICAIPTGTLVDEGAVCQPPDIECRSGHFCHDEGGVPVCRRFCDVASGCADPATHTCDRIGPTGSLFFEGLEIGACVPIGGTCGGATCTAAEDCVGNVCRMPCGSDGDCPSGLDCRDPDGDGRLHCYVAGPSGCAGDADCSGATSRCVNTFCLAPCSGDDSFCVAIGSNRCVRPPGFSEAFCLDDCATGACPAGMTCMDGDADGFSECYP